MWSELAYTYAISTPVIGRHTLPRLSIAAMHMTEFASEVRTTSI